MDGPTMIFGVNLLLPLNAEAVIMERSGHARVLLLIDWAGRL
jgi:hypothetical protein